jgi:hypothetical protein
METGAVVKALAGEGLEVFHRAGSHFRPKGDHHLALRGLDDSNFVLWSWLWSLAWFGRFRRLGFGFRFGSASHANPMATLKLKMDTNIFIGRENLPRPGDLSRPDFAF